MTSILLTSPKPTPETPSGLVEPNIEIKLDKDKRIACREIVAEINRFGVSQRQKLYLINLLALELENREVMVALVSAIGANRDKVQDAPSIIVGGKIE